MKFLRLPDPLLSVLYEDEDILAIDKPYGLNTHTNDSKLEHSDFIQDGLIEIFEKQLNCKLHIIHRLDQTTTGIVIFGKSQESAKKYAQYFFDRQVRKTYFFITARKSVAQQFSIDQAIIHKGKELQAKTNLKFLKRNSLFELWQANPLTGRNHQIRIHSLAAQISILGDTKYEGQGFPFLCLHNHRIEFPNSLVINSKPPAYFDSLDILQDRFLSQLLFEADRRQRLFSKYLTGDVAFRMIELKEQCSVDQFGANLVLSRAKQSGSSPDSKQIDLLSNFLKKPILLRDPKHRDSVDKKYTRWIIHENGSKFEVAQENGPMSGLSTNQRLHRYWVQNNSNNKSVLNLFASMCSYGVAAARGGATQVSMVEQNKNSLSLGKKNFELNQLNSSEFKFFRRDSMVFLKQCANKQQKFDLILCEIPSFYRSEKGTFQIQNDLAEFLDHALKCLHPKGTILISTTYEKFFINDLRKQILNALKDLKSEINCILPGLDFELPDQKAQLKSFLIKLL
jgi:23S rRNA (cytosine1962-C5)-methyltransferase